MPEAYRLPTMEPADVPVTTLTGILFSFKTLIMPIWAKPLDAPPPSASATTALGLAVFAVWVCGLASDLSEVWLGQAASMSTTDAVSVVRSV